MAEARTVLNMIDARKAMSLNFAAGLPLMFMGASGIGKTEVAEQYAASQGPDYGMFELNLALASLPDLIGLQRFVSETHVDAYGVERTIESARFAWPYFLRDKRDGRPAFCFKRGVIVIEEYGQGEASCKRATGQLIQHRRAGEHQAPPGCDVLLLSNRAEDRSGVSKDFDFLINRRNQIELRADLDGWLIWAHEAGMMNMTMAYAARNQEHVFANKAPEKQGPWMTPRSLASANAMLAEAFKSRYSLDDPFVRTNLAGIISDGHAHGFIAFAKIRDQLPSFQSILNDPAGANMPSEMDQKMFLAFDLASRAKRENMKAIVTYMKRMPKDFAIAFYRSSIQRDPTLRSTKEFGDWAVDNVALMTAVLSA